MVFSCGLVDCGVGRVCRTIVPMTPCLIDVMRIGGQSFNENDVPHLSILTTRRSATMAFEMVYHAVVFPLEVLHFVSSPMQDSGGDTMHYIHKAWRDVARRPSCCCCCAPLREDRYGTMGWKNEKRSLTKTLLPAKTSTSSLSTPSLNSFNTPSHCLESRSSLFNTSAFRPATLAIFLPSLWMKEHDHGIFAFRNDLQSGRAVFYANGDNLVAVQTLLEKDRMWVCVCEFMARR